MSVMTAPGIAGSPNSVPDCNSYSCSLAINAIMGMETGQAVKAVKSDVVSQLIEHELNRPISIVDFGIKKKAITFPNGQVIEKDTLYNEEFGKTIQGVTNPLEGAGQVWYKTDRLSDKIVAAADNTWHITVSQGNSETHRLAVFHKKEDQIREYFISIEASAETVFRIASLFPPERQIEESSDTFLPNLFNGIEASYSGWEKSERREFLKDLKEEFNLGDQKLEERKEKISQLINRFVRETLSSNETVEAIGVIGQAIAQLAGEAKSILRQIPYASLPPLTRLPLDTKQTEQSAERRLVREKENPGLTGIILNEAPIVKPIFQKIAAFENDEIPKTEPVISKIELMTVNEETSEGKKHSAEDSFIAVMILQHIMSASVAESQTEISNAEISDHFEVIIPLIPSLIGLLEEVEKISDVNINTDVTAEKSIIEFPEKSIAVSEESLLAGLILQLFTTEDNFEPVTSEDNKQLYLSAKPENWEAMLDPEDTLTEKKLEIVSLPDEFTDNAYMVSPEVEGDYLSDGEISEMSVDNIEVPLIAVWIIHQIVSIPEAGLKGNAAELSDIPQDIDSNGNHPDDVKQEIVLPLIHSLTGLLEITHSIPDAVNQVLEEISKRFSVGEVLFATTEEQDFVEQVAVPAAIIFLGIIEKFVEINNGKTVQNSDLETVEKIENQKEKISAQSEKLIEELILFTVMKQFLTFESQDYMNLNKEHKINESGEEKVTKKKETVSKEISLIVPALVSFLDKITSKKFENESVEEMSIEQEIADITEKKVNDKLLLGIIRLISMVLRIEKRIEIVKPFAQLIQEKLPKEIESLQRLIFLKLALNLLILERKDLLTRQQGHGNGKQKKKQVKLPLYALIFSFETHLEPLPVV